MASKSFPLGSILGAIEGTTLDTGFQGVSEVLVFFGANPYSDASIEGMRAKILEQYPLLKDFKIDENWEADLAAAKTLFGNELALTN